MRVSVRLFHTLLLLTMAAFAYAGPLDSWQDTDARQAIVEFVEKTTQEGSPDFVPPRDRIAVFDNDGTLWAEQPVYFQLMFAIDRLRLLAEKHPARAEQEPYKTVLGGDLKKVLHESSIATILDIVTESHSGMTAAQFDRIARDWIKNARHPTKEKPFTGMVYQPMLELLEYLRAHGYKTFIASGGGRAFMRAWVEETYGIPPEQVIGSSVELEYKVIDGKPSLVRKREIGFLDDKEGKPVGIYRRIGRKPVIAFGNSDGDREMLEWTASREGPSLVGIIHHTDSAREWAYDRDSKIGKLDKALEQAGKENWLVVDMAKDWKRVFPD
ncbi:HAD family hydrolase [Biformimicrobium ophioploci]|uniref:HAD family hydrolase n=1 Tax=Biformimicrobium ophioploci TaxID=3036711 RepID=A0ABQ6LUQ3_9GAMM|nr:HAD family hydrolase [Microbulbifer sp. NKW57]GMG85817.1 HAD family hydrolase [Microbulbifer sp. NKW57]